MCSQCSHSATDSGGVRWASKIHGGSAQQLPYVPNYQYTFELWKLSSNSCQSQAAQSARLWWLCRQQWVTLGTLAKIFLQLHSSKASNAPYNLVSPVRVTGCSTCQLLCLKHIFIFPLPLLFNFLVFALSFVSIIWYEWPSSTICQQERQWLCACVKW